MYPEFTEGRNFINFLVFKSISTFIWSLRSQRAAFDGRWSRTIRAISVNSRPHLVGFSRFSVFVRFQILNCVRETDPLPDAISSFRILGNLKLKHGTIRFQMRDAYWTKKRRFKICLIGVVHFEYFRADALRIIQLVSCVSFRNSYIGCTHGISGSPIRKKIPWP